MLDGIITEMKAPEGGGKNTITNNFREVKRNFRSLPHLDTIQAVIDISRSGLTDEQARQDIQMCLRNPRFSKIGKIFYINHDGEETEFTQ